MKISDFKLLSFDVYGTLIDWETGILQNLESLTNRLTCNISNDEILEKHAYFESSIQKLTPTKKYSEILSLVYNKLAEKWKIKISKKDSQDYGNSVGKWPVFNDSKQALIYLKQHYKIVVLTNVDNISFEKTKSLLGIDFDEIFTAEDIGSYKPDKKNFLFMIEFLKTKGFEINDILHVAESMFHDHFPANKHGLNNCHIYRRFDKKGYGATMKPEKIPTVKFRYNSMKDLVNAHNEEINFLK